MEPTKPFASIALLNLRLSKIWTSQRKKRLGLVNYVNISRLLHFSIVQLSVPGSQAKYKIYSALLQKKCAQIYNLWSHSKPEVYHCEEIEETGLRIVLQWAYSGDYNTAIDGEPPAID